MRPNHIGHLFHKFFKNLFEVFSPKNLPWHILAVVLTIIIYRTGFDWSYYTSFKNTFLYPFSFSAAIIGGLAPILFPLALYLIANIKNNLKLGNTAFALGQAAMIGSLVSSFYKSLTGRGYPPNLSFHFSWFQSGIFWGWPSSHTTIAFAMAVSALLLYPENKKIKLFAWAYAFYIGLFVAMSIHWFSDFVAGAIIGTVIGLIVGKSFRARFVTMVK